MVVGGGWWCVLVVTDKVLFVLVLFVWLFGVVVWFVFGSFVFQVQRFSAKALANLASTDKDTRIAVIRQVEERIPSWTEFDDSIVNVYLEMLFTN